MTGKWLSVPAVLWAMDEAPGVPVRLRSTHWAVARFTDENGCGAYPLAAEVARITGKSKAQAARDMAELVKLGLLLPGDPALVKEIRADRRPNVYDLPMPRGASGRVSSKAPRVASGRDPSKAPRGASDNSTSRMGLQNESHLDAPRTRREQDGRSPAPARARPPQRAGASKGAGARRADLDGRDGSAPNVPSPPARSAGEQAAPGPPPKRPWCGQCDERTRMINMPGENGKPDQAAYCPTCSSRAVPPAPDSTMASQDQADWEPPDWKPPW
jgi:hypothetical protein